MSFNDDFQEAKITRARAITLITAAGSKEGFVGTSAAKDGRREPRMDASFGAS
jgi:hypothetical protein